MLRFLCTLVVICTLASQVAVADLVISIGSSDANARTNLPTFEAGSRVTLGLYIHNDLPNSALTAQTFGLGFDLSLPGAENLYDGHNSSQLNRLYSNFRVSAVVSGDALITDPSGVASSDILEEGFDVFFDFTASAPIIFGARGTQETAIHIANISFSTASNTPGGVYGFKFNPNASFPGGFPANSVSSGLGLAAGLDGSVFNRFVITAVPEPSSVVVLAGVLAYLGLARRQRRELSSELVLAERINAA